MTVILKMMGRKYRAYMSKRAPRAADSSPKMRQACLETADRLHHASPCQQLAPAQLQHAAFVLNNVDLVGKPIYQGKLDGGA